MTLAPYPLPWPLIPVIDPGPLSPGKDPKRWKPADRELYAGYYAEFQAQARETDLREGVGQDMKVLGAMTYQFFHQRKTAIRQALEQAVGPLAEAYAVQNLTGQRRPCGFGLRLTAEQVTPHGRG